MKTTIKRKSSYKPIRKPKARKSKTQVERELIGQMKEVISLCFELNEQSFALLAADAELSIGTLYRLWWGVTERPQFLTIQKLCRACDLEIKINNDKGVVLNLTPKLKVAA